MKGTELEIFFVSETGEKLLELNLVGPVSVNDKRIMTFYQIDSISPWFDLEDDEKEYCQILSGGVDFICADDYETVKKKIENG